MDGPRRSHFKRTLQITFSMLFSSSFLILQLICFRAVAAHNPFVDALISFLGFFGIRMDNFNADTPKSSVEFESGQNANVGRIVNGTKVADLAYPWMASIQSFAGHRCGATLINATALITAAHCKLPIREDLRVLARLNNLYDPTTALQFRVLSINNHPNYSFSPKLGHQNDVAIWRIELVTGDSSKIPLNSIVLDDGTFSKDNTTLKIAGWGKTTEKSPFSTNLMESQVVVINQNQCQSIYTSLDQSMLCAYAPYTDVCEGDSGGPLFAIRPNGKVVLVGITSYGYGCAREDFPGVYTRVSSLAFWIANNQTKSPVGISTNQIIAPKTSTAKL